MCLFYLCAQLLFFFCFCCFFLLTLKRSAPIIFSISQGSHTSTLLAFRQVGLCLSLLTLPFRWLHDERESQLHRRQGQEHDL